MIITQDDLLRKSTGELARLFSAAKADVRNHPPMSEASRRAWNTVTMIRAEINRRQP